MKAPIVALSLVIAGAGCKTRTPASTPSPTPSVVAAATTPPKPVPKPPAGYEYEVPSGMRILEAANSLSLEGTNLSIRTKTIHALASAKDAADSEHADFQPTENCTVGEVHPTEIRGTEGWAFSETCPDREAQRFVFFKLSKFKIAQVTCEITTPPGAAKCDELLASIHVREGDEWRAVISYIPYEEDSNDDWSFYNSQVAIVCEAAGNFFASSNKGKEKVTISLGTFEIDGTDGMATEVDITDAVSAFDSGWVLVSPGPKLQALDFDPTNAKKAEAFCRGE